MKFLAGFMLGLAAGIAATPRWFWHVIYWIALAAVAWGRFYK